MTQKTNAVAHPGCGNQGISADGTKSLSRKWEKPTAQPIPTAESIRTSAIADLQYKLARIANITDSAAAKAAIYDILDAGWHTVDPRELIRAIEARLPRATPTQIDAGNLRRSKSTGKIIPARVLGAIGDQVIILCDANPDGRPYYVRIVTIPQYQPIPTAAWDVTRPKCRRSNSPIIDADNRRTYPPIPTGRMIIC